MKQRLRSIRREFEDRAVVIRAAEIGGAIDISGVVQCDAGAGIRAVIGLSGKVMQVGIGSIRGAEIRRAAGLLLKRKRVFP